MTSATFGLLLASAVLSSLCHSALCAKLLPLTKADKQAILDTHNILRDRIARGQIKGQPSSGDMMLLEWDDRLMEKAATWASKCIAGHDQASDREIPGHGFVGQNWIGGGSQNLSFLVQSWFDEYKDYTFDGNSGVCATDKLCGHYTQVVWSKSLLVGCAYADCQPDYLRVLVCNYADGGNVGTLPPYERAPPATKCLAEFVYTMGGVCLRKDQCPDPDSCRCALTCANGAALDSDNCKCGCASGFFGSRCELICSDPPEWRESCESDSDACKNYPVFCPKTCKRCIIGDIRDKNAVNADGVVARVPARDNAK